MKIKNIIGNHWIVGICTSIIAGLIFKIIELVFGIEIFSSIFRLFKQSILKIWVILNLKLPSYVVVGLFLLGYISNRIINHLNKNTKKGRGEPFLSYTEDIFEDVQYRWGYKKSNDGKYYLTKIVKYCPDCICRIVDNQCQKCKKNFLDIKTREQIEALVRYSIEKKFNINEFVTLA
jgi:hypothetical protein